LFQFFLLAHKTQEEGRPLTELGPATLFAGNIGDWRGIMAK